MNEKCIEKAWMEYLLTLEKTGEKLNESDYKFEDTQIAFQWRFLYKFFKAGFLAGRKGVTDE